MSDIDVRNEALRKLTELAVENPGFVAGKIREYEIMPLPAKPTEEQLVEAIATGHANRDFITDLYRVADKKFMNAGGIDPISAVASAVGDSIKGITGAITAKANAKSASVTAAATTKQKMFDYLAAKKGALKADLGKAEDSVSKNMGWYIGGGIGFLVLIFGIVMIVKNRQDNGGE